MKHLIALGIIGLSFCSCASQRTNEVHHYYHREVEEVDYNPNYYYHRPHVPFRTNDGLGLTILGINLFSLYAN